MKNRYFLLFIICLSVIPAFSQVHFFGQNHKKNQISRSDSILLEALPVLELPESLKNRDLPPVHDNSGSKYLRPVFNQNSSNCGQASGIAYNFTYEINRLRDLSSKDSVNQYPSHFTWNFQNSGQGYFGVSYLHSFEILKKAGNPTVPVYGAMDNTNGVEWMTGYDRYYSSMHNRIRGVSQIKVNTDEGLLTLKNWLNNHLEGSEVGGLASFYGPSPYSFQILPDDSPEAGKKVMADFGGTSASHAMTIVGYNDSIRYDYNGDGQYTNDLDINSDGHVDMKDWEIGGLKFVNSYSVSWADSGYCYMMYKTLADDLSEGGIWNHCVHVLDAKADYEPLLTFKFTIKHDYRGKLKITAGVSTDTASLIPEHVMDFPIFNYQGGNQYMQGYRELEANKYLETGLDITPLLAYIHPGEPAKFFLQVTETDPLNEGTGSIIGLTLMDYNNGLIEIPCDQQDEPLVENGTTRLGIVHSPSFEQVVITTNELPAVGGGNEYQAQMEAQHGLQPYRWDMITTWHEQRYDLPMPEIDDEKLYPESPTRHFTAVKLQFEFPFFGDKFDSVYVHENGFIMFAPDLYPWPYFNDPYILFKKVKNISAFNFTPVKYYNDPLDDEPEIWYEGNEYFAAFRWNGPLYYFDELIGEGEFAVVLYPDGNVDFFYNNIQVDEPVVWYGGVSAGNETDFTLMKNAGSIILPEISSYRMIPEPLPEGLNLSTDGILSGNIGSSENIYNLTIQVADDHEITGRKVFRLSDGLIFDYIVNAGDGGLIQNGQVFTVDLTIKNIYQESFQNVNAVLVSDDPFLDMIGSTADFGNIQPGESKTVEDAFQLKVLDGCPNGYDFFGDLNLSSDEADWNGKMSFEAYSPSMRINDFRVTDDNNNRLDPGETAEIAIKISNSGVLNTDNVEVSLSTSYSHISVIDQSLDYGNMIPGEEKTMYFEVVADDQAPVGETANFEVLLTYNNGVEVARNYEITIGQFTALVFRKGSNPASAESILDALDNLGLEASYTTTLPDDFGLYRSVFICLGGFLESSALTTEEASLLVAYLQEGGKIYMEGTMTWTYDPRTALHSWFRANPEQIPFYHFTQITGVEGTLSEGMDFTFSGANNFVPCVMNPEETAYSIFTADGVDEQCIALANPAWAYKTIGSVVEFGALGDENNSNERRDYMHAILNFFGLEEYITDVPEVTPVESNSFEVGAYPNPFSAETAITVDLQEVSHIDIGIYDLSGSYIRKLSSDVLNPGSHSITWNGRDTYGRQVPPGIYIYQVTSGEITKTGKILRVK